MKKIGNRHLLTCALALMVAAPLTFARDVNISGFLSVGGGFVDDESSVAYNGYDEEDLTFKRNLLGLQVSGEVADKITATAQLIARGNEDYEVDAEWAYVSWQASESVKVRAGRLRTPLYMYSDFIDVGYTYAWITPPSEVYFSPFNNVDGVDVYLTNTLGVFDTTLQVYMGSFDDEFIQDGITTATRARNQVGISGTIGKDWWTLRAAHHRSELTVDLAQTPLGPDLTIGGLAIALENLGFPDNAQRLLSEEDDVQFTEVGLSIDTGRFVAAVEYIEFDPGESALAKNIRHYVMVGVRSGEWLFHVTSAKAKDEAATPETGIPGAQVVPIFGSTDVIIGTLRAIAGAQVVERDVISLGTRWDVTTGTAIKLQLDDVDDLAGDQKVYSVALQTVF